MTGQQVFIFNENNLIPENGITASVLPSDKPIRAYADRKTGNGTLRAYGPFSGNNDKKVQVRVNSETGNPIPTSPVILGSGDGELKNIKIKNGVSNQLVTVVCRDIGTDSEYATIEFEGQTYRYLVKGSAGNDVYLLIDESNLVFTEADMSTITELNVGDTGLSGPEWDFNTPSLQGNIVPNTIYSRLAFGIDRVNIYVQYKALVEGEYKYYFISPIKRAVRAGTPVYFVTGYRRITVTDGSSSSETFSRIVTRADFWQAVKGIGNWSSLGASSILYPVETSINLQRTIDSPAVYEITTKTDAHFLTPYAGDNASDYAGELYDVEVDDDAPTELIEVKCVNDDIVGEEVFSVIGSISGELGEAIAGEPFSSSVVDFLVPRRYPPNWGTDQFELAGWNYDYDPVSDAPATECVLVKLGVAARKQTLTLRYTEIPKDYNGVPLQCPSVDWNEDLLGLSQDSVREGGDVTVGTDVIRNLIMWVDARKTMMAQKWFDTRAGQSYYGDGFNTTGNYPLGPTRFATITNDFWCIIKWLAYYIYEAPRDVTSTLVGLQDDLYDLVDSLEIFVNMGPLLPNGDYLKWDGEKWVTQSDADYWGTTGKWYEDLAVPGSWAVKYDTDLFWSMYTSLMDYYMTYEGKKKLQPLFAECDEVEVSGDYFWKFVESSKKYLPVYEEVPYYSSVVEDGAIIYTKEFALYISALDGSFTEGDEITITIEEDAVERTHHVGDITLLPLIAAQTLQLSGGVDGNDRYIFGVEGENSDLQNLTEYTLSRITPQSYSYPAGAANPLISFLIEEGEIDFALGDKFQFYIEGGTWQYRVETDGVWGAWSSSYNISTSIQSIGDGINLLWELGVYPSFKLNDTWTLYATQEHRASNMLNPFNFTDLKYVGVSGAIEIDMGEAVLIQCMILDLHNIDTDIELTVSDDPSFGSPSTVRLITNRETIWESFSPALEGRYVKLDSADSTIWTNIEIGYLFLGPKMQLSLDAKIQPVRRWKTTDVDVKEAFSFFDFLQKGFEVIFDSIQWETDFVKLISMMDYLKENGNQPFYFIVRETDTVAYRVQLDIKEILASMPIDLNAPDDNRIYQWTLPLIGSVV